MKRVVEAMRYYNIIRVTSTETEWLVHVDTLETVEATWTDFMKYTKKKYTISRTDKRHGCVYVK